VSCDFSSDPRLVASSSLLSICFVAVLQIEELLFPVTLAMFALSNVAEVRIADFAALQRVLSN